MALISRSAAKQFVVYDYADRLMKEAASLRCTPEGATFYSCAVYGLWMRDRFLEELKIVRVNPKERLSWPECLEPFYGPSRASVTQKFRACVTESIERCLSDFSDTQIIGYVHYRYGTSKSSGAEKRKGNHAI